MPLSFLIPLFPAFIAGSIVKKCNVHLGDIADILAVVSLIVSFVLAPRQLHALLLVSLLSALSQKSHGLVASDLNNPRNKSGVKIYWENFSQNFVNI